MSKQKQQTKEQRELEAAAAKALGRHVTREKGRLLLVFTALACLVPAALGLRLWDSIPPIVETGLIGVNGEDDSLPRWALVFMIPGLFCLLDVINHWQFRRFQRMEQVPPRHTRLLGRWGFPLLSLLFCAWAMPKAAGQTALTPALLVWWLAGWALMLLGGHLWDCPRDSKLALRFPACAKSEANFRAVHRVASAAALTAGLLLALQAALLPAGASVPAVTACILAVIAVPGVYAWYLDRDTRGN